MTQQMPSSNSTDNQTLSTEQFNQIIEAILSGKYSLACLLLLRYIGHDPQQYIPYRTYNRLLKENCNIPNTNSAKTVPINKNKQKAITQSAGRVANTGLSNIVDLGYIEKVDQPSSQIKGGNLGWYSI